jgi:ABC-type transporter Mla subunit MlaD
VREGDKFSLIAKGILGDMYIEVNPGPKDLPPVKSGYLFEGQPSFSLNDILGGSGTDLVGDLTSSIKAIADLLVRNQAALDAIIRDIQTTAANARVISDNLAETSKALPQVTDEVLSSLDTLSKSVNELSTAVDLVVGQLKGNIDSSATDLAASLKNIKEASSQVQAMVDQLSTKDSVISTLSSSQTSKSVTDTLENLQETSRALLKATQDTQVIIEGVKEMLGPLK